MGAVRDTIRSLTPAFLLRLFRSHKKKQVRKQLEQKKQSGKAITCEQLINDLKTMGIAPGDTVLVHSSMSKIGYLEAGPKTVVDALMQAIGGGNLLMPSSPNASLQKEYIETLEAFDLLNSPSRLGAITEYFRTMEGVQRSFHPTEPVCAMGPDAEYLVGSHFGELTPYTQRSPFYRVSEKEGKILYIGVTLDNAGTNLHTMEDAVAFKYPVYADKVYEVQMIDANGETKQMKTRVHNPDFSRRRKCDQLLPMFEQQGAMKTATFGEAKCLVFDAKKMFEVMVAQYQQHGITMYTPNGEEITY